MESSGGGFFADRSSRAKLRFSGPQAAWFLHQVTTQAFEDIGPGDARDGALITAHGRMVGYFEAVSSEDVIYAHFEPELRDSFPEALGKYVVATRVDIADVTEDWGLVLVAGEAWESLAGRAPAGAIVHPTHSLGIPAAYLWTGRSEVTGLLLALADAGANEATEHDLEAIRVGHGVPRWGREMDGKTIPLEVGIEGHAIDFDKGCYVGQEAIAKIHFRGKPNRRLARVSLDDPVVVPIDVADGDTIVGRITSASGRAGLAVVRHTVVAGARLSANGTTATILD